MSINFKQNVIQYVIDIFNSCGGEMIELEKGNKNIPGKYKWKTLNVISLMTFTEVDHSQPILHMSKIMVHCYSTDVSINQFTIHYNITTFL